MNSRTTSTIATQTNKIEIKSIRVSKRLTAYILTASCDSPRFNGTKENIEKVFPNYFDIVCYKSIPLNDSRVDPSPALLWKKFSSNLIAFVDIWTYKIHSKPNSHDLEWTFIFEDDVRFNDPRKVFLPNYISALEEMMDNPEIQIKDGFFYLGICGPAYNDTQPLISKNTKNTLQSRKGCGYCLHASAITKRRSRLFWAEISSYRPSLNDASLDLHVRSYSIRSKNYFYILGTNFLYPPGTGHYGIAYQDRGKFSTTVA